MTTFHYPLPSDPERNNPYAGFSEAARDALANVAIGESLADSLLHNPLEELQQQAEALQQATDDLNAFARQVYPNSAQEQQVFKDTFSIDYDQDTKQAKIWMLDANYQKIDIANASLNLSSKGITGKLLLPKQLQISRLDCYYNQLTQLPELPVSLTTLDCDSNQLTQLPELPASLTTLHCSGNQLTQLPELPASLILLYCFGNPLSSKARKNVQAFNNQHLL